MQTLSDLRLAENTLLIVTSDNGPETNMYDRLQNTGHDSSGLLLGSKRDIGKVAIAFRSSPAGHEQFDPDRQIQNLLAWSI